ncbi:MATE family efflux transporter [Paenibacillus campi]|uniref:MATE family efflux transporter n=1 Tax=Paenibacillus campi TaxID=3106031 RepID=UPI002AFDD293|nr:MATE family efflux transporter [Paenibacillus sp. SGZ-1009]
MIPTTTWRQKYAQFLKILFPVFITQIALSMISFFDTNMSGHASAEDLAGVAIGSSLWIPVQAGLSGILVAITPIISHLIGGGQRRQVNFNVYQALLLSIVIALLVLAAGSLLIQPILAAMNLEAKVHDVALHFLIALSAGIVPLFAYTVLRGYIDALGQTRYSMMITLCSLPINVGLNVLFIFGKWGFPRLGGVGAGVASAITYWCLLLIALIVVRKATPFRADRLLTRLYAPSGSKWREMLKLGVPMGFAIFFETAVFAGVTLLMSRYDTMTIAAHQAAQNFASTLYMLPLSICTALTIVVGYEVGAGRQRDARQYSKLGIGTALLLSVCTAVILLLFRHQVAALYSSDPVLIELIAHFMIFASFYQLSDAIATPVQGALRGYKDVNPAFFLTFLSYWIIGLPSGYLLATYTDWGAYGYWIGLSIGLACGAITLLARLLWVQQKADHNAR